MSVSVLSPGFPREAHSLRVEALQQLLYSSCLPPPTRSPRRQVPGCALLTTGMCGIQTPSGMDGLMVLGGAAEVSS